MKAKITSLLLIFCFISNSFIVLADIDGVLLEDTINVEVLGLISSINYDFKEGIDSTIERNGWEIIESNAFDVYRNQPYGIQIQSNNVGEYIKIAFGVPVSGYYTIKSILQEQ